MCGSISSSHQRSFVHPLSCNPHCSLQHYQMKEIPTAFDKRVVILNVWFIKLYAFLEDYCVEKPHILTCYQSYFFKNILTCCGVKESRCDECLERRRTEANSSFLHELNLKDTDLSWLPVNTMKNWEYYSNCWHYEVHGCLWNSWTAEKQVRCDSSRLKILIWLELWLWFNVFFVFQFFQDGHNLCLPSRTITPTSMHHLNSWNWIKQEIPTLSLLFLFSSLFHTDCIEWDPQTD